MHDHTVGATREIIAHALGLFYCDWSVHFSFPQISPKDGHFGKPQLFYIFFACGAFQIIPYPSIWNPLSARQTWRPKQDGVNKYLIQYLNIEKKLEGEKIGKSIYRYIPLYFILYTVVFTCTRSVMLGWSPTGQDRHTHWARPDICTRFVPEIFIEKNFGNI